MRAYLSGIGGIGMSALAGHLRAQGHTVSGSDRSESDIVEKLRTLGCTITTTQDGSGMTGDIDLFVYTEAIPVDAPERQLARERGIRSISYFQALGELTAGKDLIAISGTHGKSSTTAMVAKVLMEAGRNPSVVIGTKMRELPDGNWRQGGDQWIVEACEYRRSFLSLTPRILLITNIDGDHFDAYASMDDYEAAFQAFIEKLPKDGVIIYHGGDARSAKLAQHSGRSAIDADKEELPTLGTPGVHMQQNGQLVLALARVLGIDDAKARASLAGYAGTWRRMENIGSTRSGAIVIDDYAHHPTEIRATIAAIKAAYPDHRIVAVFQPHTHDRTLKLFDDFAGAFHDADEVYVLDVYDARPDTESETVDVRKLVTAIEEKSNVKVTYAGSVQSAATTIKPALQKSDVCLVMGAGSIAALPKQLL